MQNNIYVFGGYSILSARSLIVASIDWMSDSMFVPTKRVSLVEQQLRVRSTYLGFIHGSSCRPVWAKSSFLWKKSIAGTTMVLYPCPPVGIDHMIAGRVIWKNLRCRKLPLLMMICARRRCVLQGAQLYPILRGRPYHEISIHPGTF
jgi:hypothetical protein